MHNFVDGFTHNYTITDYTRVSYYILFLCIYVITYYCEHEFIIQFREISYPKYEK